MGVNFALEFGFHQVQWLKKNRRERPGERSCQEGLQNWIVPFYLHVFGVGVNEVMTLHIVAYKKSSGRCRSPKRDVNVTSFEKRDIFYRLARDLFISPRPASYLFYARR